MATINQLSTVDSIGSADKFVIYSNDDGDARKASAKTLADYLMTQITSTDDMTTQYAAPTATGFTTNINDNSNSTQLILTPTGTFAAGTIKLPTSTNCVDRQEILVNSTQTVTTLTLNLNGATGSGIPATIAAGGFFKLRFDKITTTWYRVG